MPTSGNEWEARLFTINRPPIASDSLRQFVNSLWTNPPQAPPPTTSPTAYVGIMCPERTLGRPHKFHFETHRCVYCGAKEDRIEPNYEAWAREFKDDGSDEVKGE